MTVDRGRWHRVMYADKDLTEMTRLAHLKLDNAERLGTPHINRFRSDRIAGYVDGFKGEWAVADALDLEWNPDTSGRADPGFDLLAKGGTIQVRYTPHMTGRLMCPANRPMKADWAVLVVGNRVEPKMVWIVGGIRRSEFLSKSQRHNWGYGPTDYLVQDHLHPWDELSKMLDIPPSRI